ncbi:poly(A)-specific ribonuclease [Dermatophagoides pteronyssinus]|uniref:Poly(A)-specific ribonuclease n=1 Tax=Dermatophagoides pteronyssinus TaxID=6956 RepID=A0ABQ8JMN2_DERPT|nr:poly(A)-specific ribonuclease [Dermatophagoides pteronyssinus]
MNYPLIFSSIVDIGSNVQLAKGTGVSCVTFDNEQEILWTGNYSGHITSFVPNPNNSLNKYTSFHVDYESDVRQIVTCKEGIFSLTKNAIRLSKRRGITKFTHKNDYLMKDLQCMLLLKNQLLMAGNQEKLIELDIETVKPTRTIDIMENNFGGHPRFICMADCDGKIVLRDSDQLRIQHQFKSAAPISAIDACGNYLVTISPYSQLMMIYDLRQTKLASVTQVYQPAHIKFLSRFTTKCCIVSRNGRFSIVDLANPSTINPINDVQMPSYDSQVTAFDISATDQAFAFGDNQNCVYIHGTCEKFDINTNRRQPEFADPIMPTPYYSLMTDHYTPISEISPFPYFVLPTMVDYNHLVSYMPTQQCLRVYRPVPPIGPDILRTMRVVGNIGYVVNSPGKIPTAVGNSSYSINNGNGSIRSSPEGNEFGTDQMPHRYHFLEPNHNKVDKDEYDFSRYNSSPFPGLDSTIPNSYANNMIQCLYFIPAFRSSVINHICNREYCLVCELGFLFHMLDIAPKHNPCQASNFFRAFRTIPEVCAFKLILPEEESLRKQFNFFKLTQQWLRFLLHQLHRESLQSTNNNNNNHNNMTLGNNSSNGNHHHHDHNKGLYPYPQQQQQQQQQHMVESQVENLKNSFVTENFSLQLTRHFLCTKCQHQWKSPYISFPVTLNYPMNIHHHSGNGSGGGHSTISNINVNYVGQRESNHDIEFNGNNHHVQQQSFVSFSELLLSSIHTEQTIQEFCENCQKLHNNIIERRLMSKLPPIFAINTGLDNKNAHKFWQTQTERFTKIMANKKEKYVVTNLSDLDRMKQMKNNSSNNNSQGMVSSVSSTNNQMPCRYGKFCKRFDCKFYHSHRGDDDDNNNEYGNDFYSWIPMSIFISKNSGTDSESSTIQIKDDYSDWNNDNKNNYIEYSLVSVTSVVKSSEETFGNIVSAIKIDKSYFDARRKQLAKKIRRYQNRYVGGQQQQTFQKTKNNNEDNDDDSDLSENEELDSIIIDDNEMFTIDSRNTGMEIESLPRFDSKMDWYLFNHYLINPISNEEVVSTDLTWKVPTILMYMKNDVMKNYMHNKLLRHAKNMINTNVFNQGLSISQKIPLKSISFLPLDLDMEQPKKGDIVAMDAEFVMLNHEETELRSDGTRATIRPSHKSVARISCVRGSGQMQGVPFIDDYISTQDQVADYMTKFSGIQPGDLDAALSSKHLTTLKSTYLKLRFLIDNGVIFVGHGLRNDFRVINLVVPPEQVIDTVYLFQSPNSKRMVSLRFLAWHFLNLNIQSETHDSIEDAKTALALYHKYKELEMNSCSKEAIENLYQIGKECGWKIPNF